MFRGQLAVVGVPMTERLYCVDSVPVIMSSNYLNISFILSYRMTKVTTAMNHDISKSMLIL